jgi:hypothetical protein
VVISVPYHIEHSGKVDVIGEPEPVGESSTIPE